MFAFETAFEAILFTNPIVFSLAEQVAVTTFLTNLFNQGPRNLPGWVILYIWALLNFISVVIILAMESLILVFCLVVWKFFLVILNVVTVLCYAVDFDLFTFVFAIHDNMLFFIRLLRFPDEILILCLCFLSKIVKTNTDSLATVNCMVF